METAEQTEAPRAFIIQDSLFPNKFFRTMADICEALSFFRVFRGLMTNIRVYSCPFVVKLLR